MDIKTYLSSGIIEMYVLDLCSEEEKKEIELLRRQYPELDAAILNFETDLEIKMQKKITLPPAGTDIKILRAIDALQPPAGHKSRIKRKPVFPIWFRMVAAAVIVLLAISITFNYILYKRTKEITYNSGRNENNVSLPLADYNILKTPTITPVAMYGVGTHSICRCTMFWDKRTGKIYIMIHHLPRSSESKDYQLWAKVNDKLVNIGIIKDEIRGRFIELGNVPPEATSFTVTLEKAGGSNVPTTEETYLAGSIS